MLKLFIKRFPALIIFLLMIATGYGLSLKHPLANDELFTQTSSIEKQSYLNLLTLKIPEGNISPLFYVLQKLFLDAIHFKLPFVWNGDWFVTDHCSQVVMRILPCLYMSLAITSIFYFFSQRYTLFAGIYALGVALSTYMTWAYWVEARPYSLWFLLSTWQYIFLIEEGSQPKAKHHFPWKMMIIHILLSLTVVFSAVQIGAAMLIYALNGERRWKVWLGMFFLPVVFCLLYYFGAPKYSFFFLDSAQQLFSANLPKDRLMLLILLGIGLYFAPRGDVRSLPDQTFFKNTRLSFGGFALLVMVGYALVLVMFNLKAHGRQEGFPLSNRYLTGLAPLGIVAVVYFTVEWIRSLGRHRWLQGMVLLTVLAFLGFRLFRTWELIRGYYHLV